MVRVRQAIGRSSAAVVDQICSSASGLLLLIAAARSDDAATFGAFSVAIICHGFLLGCARAFVGEVAMMRTRRSPDDAGRTASVALLLSVGTGALATGSLVLAGAVVGGQTGAFLTLVGLGSIPVHVQDVQRYLCFGSRRLGVAIASDAAWVVVQAALTGVLIAAGDATAERLVVTWIAGAAAGAVVAFVALRRAPAARGSRQWLAEDGARGLSFLGDFIVSTGLVQASMVVLSVLLTLEEFGALRLALVALSPLANLLAGIRALVLASLAGLRDQPAAAHRRAVRAGVVFGAAGAAYGAVVVLLPVGWVVQALGDGWEDARRFVGIIAVGEALRLASFPAIDLLKVFRSPAALVAVRLGVTLVGVATLLVGALVGGPELAAWSATFSATVAAVTWWRQASPARLRSAAAGPTGQQVPEALSSPVPPG